MLLWIRDLSNLIYKLLLTRSFCVVAIFLILGLQVAQRIFNSGLIGGLDYFLFQPDGVFYSIKAFEFLGNTHSQATELVQTFYSTHAKTAEYSSINNQFQQSLMSSRILYPMVSAPFVLIFGVWGMLFIPIVCSLVVPMHLAHTLLKMGHSHIALIATILMLSLSPTYSRWTILNYTEALNLAIFYSIIVLIDAKPRSSNRKDLMLVFLFALMGLNHAEPFLVLFFLIWAIHHRFFSKPVLSVATILLSNLIPLIISGIPVLGFQTSPENFLDFLIGLVRIPLIEIAQLAILDRALCILILFGLISLKSKYSPSMSMTLLPFLFLAFSLQTVFIGAPGTNFRYFILTVPLLLIGFTRVIDSRSRFSLGT